MESAGQAAFAWEHSQLRVGMSTLVGVLSHVLRRPWFGVGSTLMQLVLLHRKVMEILFLGNPSLTCLPPPPCGAGDRINQKGPLKPNQGATPLLSPGSRLVWVPTEPEEGAAGGSWSSRVMYSFVFTY